MCACVECNTVIEENESIETVDGGVCESCYENEYSYCEHCENTVHNEDISEVQTTLRGRVVIQYWCSSCIHDDACTCDSCGTTINNDDAISDGTISLCNVCYENDYFTCSECCEIMSTDYYGEDGICSNCQDNNPILKCSEKVEDNLGFGEPEIYNGKKLWIGLELEAEIKDGADSFTIAEKLLNDISDTCILCEDSSLNDGFEIKVRPSNFADMRHTINKICDSKAIKYLKSHDTTTCGLHIHISRDPLTQLQQSRLNYFINSPTNKPLMTTICRRYDVSYAEIDHDAKLSDIIRAWQKDYITGKVISKQGSVNSARYAAVNFNYHTIELRLPKGTLKRETLLATIEFVYALLYFVHSSEYTVNTQYDFLRWLAKQPTKDKKEHYSHLIQYLEAKLDFFTFKQLELPECA